MCLQGWGHKEGNGEEAAGLRVWNGVEEAVISRQGEWGGSRVILRGGMVFVCVSWGGGGGGGGCTVVTH